MLGRVSSTHLQASIIKQVCSFVNPLSILSYHLHTKPSQSNSSCKSSNTHLEKPQINNPLVSKAVLSKYSSLMSHKVDSFPSGSSVNELLLSISHVCPETTRKFLRVLRLEPVHVLEILVGFQLGNENLSLSAVNVGSLWEIFKRAGGGNEGFKHLPRSCEVMASMLIDAGLVREAELLLLYVENQGISMAGDEIFCGVIEGYVNAGELERAVLLYDKMKGQCLVPSLSCYRALLGLLLKEQKPIEALRVYEDLVEEGVEFGDVEARNLEVLIRFLCQDGKIKEVKTLLKKIVATGWEPSTVVLSEVSNVFCEKKDFEDLLSFFVEMGSAPDILVGNKILFSLCSHFGVERAHSFLCELDYLGFSPNEITFGIFISGSCLDGKLRDAFVYLTEILSRGLKPDRHSYNALIGGLFRRGMDEHAGDIFNEMIDNGTEPDLATYRALLAGYSKARRFSEVKFMISDMVNRGLFSPPEDPISKAFAVLGLSPSSVKVKRDNDVKNFRTEFLDELGNGLYLETNLDEFEKAVAGVLQESLVPDFNLLVMRQCDSKNVKEALLLVDEMVQWGQELSLSALNVLFRLLCESDSHVEEIPGLLDKMVQSFVLLDHGTLNLLIRALSKTHFATKCRELLYEMNQRHLPIANTTYTALLSGFCKSGTVSDIQNCWNRALKDNWVPDGKDIDTILGCLCQTRRFKEALELFDIILASNTDLGVRVCDVFAEKLCSAGVTSLAHVLVDELKQQHFELNDTVYSHLIEGYCREKRFSEALMIFDSNLPLIPNLFKARSDNIVALKDSCPRDYPLPLYTALINGFCKVGRIPEADALFTELISKTNVLNDDIYNALLHGHCQSSDLKTVKELTSAMIRRHITFSVSGYRNLVKMFCREGMFLPALGLKSFMLGKSKSSSSIIYNILIFYLFQMGKANLVESLLVEQRETGLQLDQVGYNFLIHGFSICKDILRSISYTNDMISKGLRPNNRSLRAVMYHFCGNGQVENALRLSAQIELQGWIHCSTVQYALLTCLLSHGSIHQAESFLARNASKGLMPNTINYDSLIPKFCHHGRLETAVNLIGQMLKKRIIPDSTSYNCVIQVSCVYNNLDQAMDFFNEILERNLRPSIRTWDLLTEKLCVHGRTAEAETVLSSMVEMGETPTKKMYSFVIERYRFENNLSKASELMQRMQRHGYEPAFVIQWSLISSLRSLRDREGDKGSRGFLSKLLVDSGFPSDGGAKSKPR